MKRRAIPVLLWALPALASCASTEPSRPDAAPAVDPAPTQVLDRGQLLQRTSTGDAARGEIAFEVCQGCHRRGGAGRPNGSYPRLAGQHASVLVKQLHDIQSGRRMNHKMLPFADASVLGSQQIADVAAYLEAQPPRGVGRKD